MFVTVKLKDIADVSPGYLNRSKIEPDENGSHFLIQARDVVAGVLDCAKAELVRFEPERSARDVLLRDGDVIFMARGVKNYAALLAGTPDSTLAAASFFVVRAVNGVLDPGYLAWYLNHPRAQHHFTRQSGSGVHMPVVRRASLESLDVPLPPPATQKKIAELYRLSLDEWKWIVSLHAKRTRLMEAVCLRAAEREAT